MGVLQTNREFILGSSKKQPSYEVQDHRRHVAPVPQFNVVLWIMCLAAFKKKNHFCSWCSALPSTTLKLGVAGVMYVSMWLFVDGCFFEEPGEGFFVRRSFSCCWCACQCNVDFHTHTYPLSKHTLADSVTTPQRWMLSATISFWKLCNFIHCPKI